MQMLITDSTMQVFFPFVLNAKQIISLLNFSCLKYLWVVLISDNDTEKKWLIQFMLMGYTASSGSTLNTSNLEFCFNSRNYLLPMCQAIWFFIQVQMLPVSH